MLWEMRNTSGIWAKAFHLLKSGEMRTITGGALFKMHRSPPIPSVLIAHNQKANVPGRKFAGIEDICNIFEQTNHETWNDYQLKTESMWTGYWWWRRRTSVTHENHFLLLHNKKARLAPRTHEHAIISLWVPLASLTRGHLAKQRWWAVKTKGNPARQ